MKFFKIRIRRNRPGPAMPVWEDIGQEVSVEGVVCQAAQAIDIAGKLATDSGDSGRLLEVGEYFTKLADFIVALSEHKRKNALDDKKSDIPMGFQASSTTEENED